MKVNENKSGKVASFYSGVSKVIGLNGVFMHELLVDEHKKGIGLVIGFREKSTEVIFFNDKHPTDKIYRSGEIFSVKVSDGLIGRILNGLGEPIDGFARLSGSKASVFADAPAIIDRQPVETPLTTGITLIDATLPLGRGQRQLLIGDAKLGKSTIAQDMVLNQSEARKKVFCIYVLCGKKRRELEEISRLFVKNGTLGYSMIVAATGDTPLSSQYLAPFVGCTIAEYFRDKGEDALIIYDDFSKHAKAYRDISLLLERSPGREAYPGDIFSLHSKLLERAGKLSDKKGAGSITAIPIIETQEGDITSFIPTNLISITDGQIYVERDLYQKGFLPAVNIGLSVSRVGSAAQQENLKKVTSGIRLSLSQLSELKKLTQLETVADPQTLKSLKKGELILELLKQSKHTFVDWREQTILFYALGKGYFDDVTEDQIGVISKYFLSFLRNKFESLISKISNEDINSFELEIKKVTDDFKLEFVRQA